MAEKKSDPKNDEALEKEVDLESSEKGSEPASVGESMGMDLGVFGHVPVTVSVELGRAQMPFRDVLGLGRGAVIELNREMGDLLDVMVNGRLVARGEFVVVEERLGIQLTEIIRPEAKAGD